MSSVDSWSRFSPTHWSASSEALASSSSSPGCDVMPSTPTVSSGRLGRSPNPRSRGGVDVQRLAIARVRLGRPQPGVHMRPKLAGELMIEVGCWMTAIAVESSTQGRFVKSTVTLTVWALVPGSGWRTKVTVLVSASDPGGDSVAVTEPTMLEFGWASWYLTATNKSHE